MSPFFGIVCSSGARCVNTVRLPTAHRPTMISFPPLRHTLPYLVLICHENQICADIVAFCVKFFSEFIYIYRSSSYTHIFQISFVVSHKHKSTFKMTNSNFNPTAAPAANHKRKIIIFSGTYPFLLVILARPTRKKQKKTNKPQTSTAQSACKTLATSSSTTTAAEPQPAPNSKKKSNWVHDPSVKSQRTCGHPSTSPSTTASS